MSDTVTAQQICAAGGFAPWLRKEEAKGKKKSRAPSRRHVMQAQQRQNATKAAPLDGCWQPLLAMSGVSLKPTPGPMNGWEAEHARDLDLRILAGEIVAYAFETFRFEIAAGRVYIPDFVVLYKYGFGVHEVKGFKRDDAMVKLAVAARAYPDINFSLWTKESGPWTVEAVKK